ncbi:MAG: nuclear transport factor 2 family protein [Saprospiraceae bacterium]
MQSLRILSFIILIAITTFRCAPVTEPDKNSTMPTTDLATEKAAILAILNGETKAAFTRDYAAWQTHWVHTTAVTKTYINFADSSMTETLGWEKVDDFVRTYIEEHPEPDPLPAPLMDIDVRLYGTGAWVSYEQNDPARGKKRETRLMEKVDGKWKIAGMHTTIYGSD